MSEKQRIEEVITRLRLPLILLVVMNHTHLTRVVVDGVSVGLSSPLFNRIYLLFSENFARLAVPLFFLFSGWLFFREGEAFDRKHCNEKLKRRLRSLLLPYLIWNLITLLMTGAGEMLFGALSSGNRTPIYDYSFGELLQCFWIAPQSTYSPACAPLWYIRDLMVTLLFARPICQVIRRVGGWLPLLLGVLWVFVPYRYTLWYGASLPAFFFFTLGAWCALRGRDFVAFSLKAWRMALPLYIAALCPILYFCSKGGVLYPIYNIGILCGMTLLVALAGGCCPTKRLKNGPFIAGCSFFVYAAHILPITLLTKVVAAVVQPSTTGMCIVLYFGCPIVVTALMTALYALLRRFTPRLCNLLTGGR